MARFVAAPALFFVCLLGCTTVVVHKNPKDCDRGIRYWRPKPYLFIGPAGSPDQANPKAPDPPSDEKKNPAAVAPTAAMPAKANGEPAAENLFMKVAMEIKYLPDYNEEYSIRLKPGL